MPKPKTSVTAIRLESLETNYPHLSPGYGGMMIGAAKVCLADQKHGSGVYLTVFGDQAAKLQVTWKKKLSIADQQTWKDLVEATEYAAYGIAILIMKEFAGFTVIERSIRGTGFDWWLGTDDNLFQGKVCLEVSGILQGDTKAINSRISQKKSQVAASDDTRKTAYVVVVEFGTPQSQVVRR